MLRGGFTLVELLIVLAIIGVLMGIGVPIYTTQLEKAKIRGVAANLKMLAQTGVNAVLIGDVEVPDGGSTDLSISEYVKGIDATKYRLAVSNSGGKYTVEAIYLGTDLDSEKIGDELTGCDSTQTSDGKAECKIENLTPAW